MTEKMMKAPFLALGLIIVLYALLELPVLSLHGISWDEQMDIGIARTYVDEPGGWLHGSDHDALNTRLPMYLTAIVYAIVGNTNLLTARLVTWFFGLLTLIAVYAFCRQQFDRITGVLACVLLATSPFFLSFTRIAFTESDIFVACGVTWSMFVASRLLKQRTVGWLVATAVTVGLAMAAKISAVAILPAIFLGMFFSPKQMNEDSRQSLPNEALVMAGAILISLLLIIPAGWAIALFSSMMADSFWFKAVHYSVSLSIWLGAIGYLCRFSNCRVDFISTCGFLAVLAPLTFLLLPPVHTTNPAIVLALAYNAFGYVSQSPIPILEIFGLHFFSVLFKSSLLIGLGLWLSLPLAAGQWRTRPAVRLPLLIFACYFLFLLKMPWAQTFYMVTLLPILGILAADQFVRLYKREQIIALLVACLAFGSLGYDILRCYPDYNLNGYQWLGERYLGGRSSVGYRSVVQTTSDGIEQALTWANNNIGPGQMVVTYIHPKHIIHAVSPNPKFSLLDGFEKMYRKSIFDEADYVITSINAEIRGRRGHDNSSGDIFKYPYNRKRLNSEFTKVFAVRRAYGLEVASVWRRKNTHRADQPA